MKKILYFELIVIALSIVVNLILANHHGPPTTWFFINRLLDLSLWISLILGVTIGFRIRKSEGKEKFKQNKINFYTFWFSSVLLVIQICWLGFVYLILTFLKT
jgi:hypothetical protein